MGRVFGFQRVQELLWEMRCFQETRNEERKGYPSNRRMSENDEGWGWVFRGLMGGSRRKFHYFVADREKSLCNRYYHAEVRKWYPDAYEYRLNELCKTCWRRLKELDELKNRPPCFGDEHCPLYDDEENCPYFEDCESVLEMKGRN